MEVKPGSQLWQYLSPQQRVLLEDGQFLIEDSALHIDREPTDYSYIVFPFAKMFEGFLKQLFRDLDIISSRDYFSDKFRIGRSLSPNLARALHGHSAYREIEKRFGKGLSTRIWHTWKEGRNLVFHYFPHNYRALTRQNAIELVNQIIGTMEESVAITKVRPRQYREDVCYVGSGGVQSLQ